MPCRPARRRRRPEPAARRARMAPRQIAATRGSAGSCGRRRTPRRPSARVPRPNTPPRNSRSHRSHAPPRKATAPASPRRALDRGESRLRRAPPLAPLFSRARDRRGHALQAAPPPWRESVSDAPAQAGHRLHRCRYAVTRGDRELVLRRKGRCGVGRARGAQDRLRDRRARGHEQEQAARPQRVATHTPSSVSAAGRRSTRYHSGISGSAASRLAPGSYSDWNGAVPQVPLVDAARPEPAALR